MGTKYDNTDWTKCARTYGASMVIIGLAGIPNVAQGNYGVPLPCRGCWIQKREGDDTIIKVSIGTPATVVFGIEIGLTYSGTSPLWLPISDVNQLYFYGVNNTIVDVIYLVG